MLDGTRKLISQGASDMQSAMEKMLEIKLKYSAKTEPEGLEQLGSYMGLTEVQEVWLVIFDRNKDAS